MRQLPFEYAFRNLGRSRVRLAASLLGAVLVVLLVLAAAGFARGMQRTLTSGESIHVNVMIMGVGSEEAVERSQIDGSIEGITTASVAGIKTEGDIPFVSPEIHIALPVFSDKESKVELASVMRGVREVALLVHPAVEIVEGHFPRSGEQQLMVGSMAHVRLGVPEDRLAIGKALYFDNRPWEIVGHFSAPNTVMDAELWVPLPDLQIASKRENTLSCVVVSMGEGRFADVDLFTKSRLDLEITAQREADYYSSIAAFYRPIRIMIIITASLIAVGGLLGGLNTMYAAFAARVREVGMLQALGYRRIAIALNLVEESVFAAACGTVIGLAIGMVALDGVAVRFSMGAFALILDAPVILTGIAGGLFVGLVGAVPPAIRCFRLPVPEALKAF